MSDLRKKVDALEEELQIQEKIVGVENKEASADKGEGLKAKIKIVEEKE